MRYRLLASYQGAPYEAGIGPGESGVVLFAACPPPEDLHFEPATGHWRKTVRRGEVQSLYESRPVGLFRGERCVILDDLTDRLHITYLGHDALKAEHLGYWEVDRGVFELIAPRQEVTEVVEQRLPLTESAEPNGPLPGEPPTDVGRRSPLGGDHRPGEMPSDSPSLPLPLEAQAMRAASGGGRREFTAGLSEPSARSRPSGGDPAAVPSWIPKAHVLPQWAAQSENGTSKSNPPGEPAPDEEGSPGRPDAGKPGESLPGLGYGGYQGAAGYSQTGRPASSNGYYGPASAQALADAAAQHSEAQHSETQHPEAQHSGAQQESGESRFSRRRRSAKRRMTTQRIFSDLASQAGIPAKAYAIGEDVDGAMCLVQTGDGFEVFNSLGGARHEVRAFGDEESAYFYLFGVLAAEAVRTGALGVLGPRA